MPPESKTPAGETKTDLLADDLPPENPGEGSAKDGQGTPTSGDGETAEGSAETIVEDLLSDDEEEAVDPATLDAPEGVDAEMFRSVVGERKLSKEAATELAETLKAYETHRAQAEEKAAAARIEALEKRPQWREEKQYLKAALVRGADRETRERILNSPAFTEDIVGLLVKVGKALQPAGKPADGVETPPKKNPLAAMYPSMAAAGAI